MIVEYIKKHKSVLWFLILPSMTVLYYLLKLFISSYHAVYVPLDDKIPFVSAFVIPYVLWFLYVPGMMLLLYLSDEKTFNRRMTAFVSGIIIAVICFVVYPTVVTFRPSAEGKGIFFWILRLVYTNDTPPSNAFPSLHCYQAVMLHLLAFVNGPLKNRKILRILSFVLVVLICSSTVLIKQHSIIDVVAGLFMAAVIFAILNSVNKKRG